MKTDQEIQAEVLAVFGFKTRSKKARRKPSRCLRCNKVSKHIYCADCRADRA